MDKISIGSYLSADYWGLQNEDDAWVNALKWALMHKAGARRAV